MMPRNGFIAESLIALMIGASSASVSAAAVAVDFSPQRVEPWADKVFGEALKQRRFAGLGITTVQHGAVTFTKTYGYADARLQKPIDPAVTRFRVASITKTMTAIAVAILLDEGRIKSLDDPANNYLKRAHLPRAGAREITLWDLLNHRGGIEDWVAPREPCQRRVAAGLPCRACVPPIGHGAHVSQYLAQSIG